MKNFVILHLESISRQRLSAFASALPHTTRLIREAFSFDNFFSSATSTLMSVAYLFHGNDFEYDTATTFEGIVSEVNNPHLFSILRDSGYHANLICLNGYQHVKPIRLRCWSSDLPPAWDTHDFPSLLAKFDALTDAAPFAIYVWDLITHIEHSLALAPHSHGLTDQVRRAYAVADDAVGKMRAILERKGLLENTTIVLYGDHGDDTWTHGFKGGLIHGTDPYTDMIWTPLAIRDPALVAGTSDVLASTIDIAPTCLSVLGVAAKLSFPYSGVDLLQGGSALAFSQNLTANQAEVHAITKAFAVTDQTYTLMVSARGLEMYAHRLDPGNHCNLLHFFTLDAGGRPVLRSFEGAARHFQAAWLDNPRAVESLAAAFERLRGALAARVAAKRAYILGRGVQPDHALDPGCLDVISHEGRDAFYRGRTTIGSVMPEVQFSYRLR